MNVGDKLYCHTECKYIDGELIGVYSVDSPP